MGDALGSDGLAAEEETSMPVIQLEQLKRTATSTSTLSEDSEEDDGDGAAMELASEERLVALLRHDSDTSEGEEDGEATAVDQLLRRASTDAARLRALLDQEDGGGGGGGGDGGDGGDAAPSLEDLLQRCEAPG